LVTDPGLAPLPPVQRALQVQPAGLFTGVQPNPVGSNVSDGVEAYRAGGHDGVVAMGGGSALDAGKAIALMVGQTRPLFDFEDREDWYTRVNAEGMAPVVAIPTTAGTGSEVGRVAVITDESTRVKKLIFHPRMLPGRVILDPELTVGLPPAITAYTGMDALAHSLEAYCSPLFHPMADGIGLEALRLIKESLPRAFREGTDLEARSAMLAAATMGAAAFQKGLGAVHSLSHPVGARHGLHHGLLNAIFMPYVLAFNRPAVETRIERAAAYLGLRGFEGFQAWLLELRRELGIPHRLDLPGADVEALARLALEDPSTPTNPVPLTEAALRGLLEQAMAGRVAEATSPRA
ncbi:MAG: iron-containing alcohol dehydrogenase, partial [Candidatus Eremiobacterota bacterium]